MTPESVSESPSDAVGHRRSIHSIVDAARAAPDLAFACLLGSFFCVLRFVALEQSPPAFFSDEFRAALHHICLAELGISGYGEPWPTFVPGAGGGLYTPPFLYIGALWVKIFGPTIASCRALAAAFTLLSTLGVACVARRAAGDRVAVWAFLAAALSPWAFQFARIAWDPPMAPAFLIWAVFFWLARAHRLQLICAGALFGLALHSYPPTRIQAPLVFAVLGVWALYRRTLKLSHVLLFGIAGVLVAYPVIKGTLDGSLNGRGQGEAIFNQVFITRGRGIYDGWFYVLQAGFDNLAAHFHPTFLFLIGDRNYRHSTEHFGVFGLLDDLALAVVAWWLLKMFLQHGGLRGRAGSSKAEVAVSGEPFAREWRLAAFAVIGYVLGILPAALCWSGVPHALRAIGAAPFLALATGVVLNAASRAARRFSPFALTVGTVHALLFGYIFFVMYPELPKVRDWYDGHVNDVMMDPKFDPKARRAFIRANPEGFRYYSIAYRGETCASSDVLFKRYTLP